MFVEDKGAAVDRESPLDQQSHFIDVGGGSDGPTFGTPEWTIAWLSCHDPEIEGGRSIMDRTDTATCDSDKPTDPRGHPSINDDHDGVAAVRDCSCGCHNGTASHVAACECQRSDDGPIGWW